MRSFSRVQQGLSETRQCDDKSHLSPQLGCSEPVGVALAKKRCRTVCTIDRDVKRWNIKADITRSNRFVCADATQNPAKLSLHRDRRPHRSISPAMTKNVHENFNFEQEINTSRLFEGGISQRESGKMGPGRIKQYRNHRQTGCHLG